MSLTAAYFDLNPECSLEEIIKILDKRMKDAIGRNSYPIADWLDLFAGKKPANPCLAEFEGIATDLKVVIELLFQQFKDDLSELSEFYEWIRMFNGGIIVDPMIRDHFHGDLSAKSIEHLFDLQEFLRSSDIQLPEFKRELELELANKLELMEFQ